MAETTKVSKQGPLKWFVWPCKWFWEKRTLLWSAILLNLLLGILVTLLFTDPAGLAKLPIGWAFQNFQLIALIFIVVLALTIISWAGSHIPVTASTRELKRRYLTSMIRETEHITLKGIPAGLIAESVRLDEVFIPMQLWANRPRTDYPLTDVALEKLRHHLKSGAASDEERIIIEAERDWQQHLTQSQRITIADMWQQLTLEHPAAVIQGFPGMGKSTLMERLTLHMARSGLRLPDPDMPEPERLQPALVPVLVRLGLYASTRTQTPGLTLEDYLISTLHELDIAGVDVFVRQCLAAGRTLVMLDGLDEVSDPDMRQQVQEAIRVFIRNQRDTSKASYNRFLITSRVAGYDQHAFPDYLHFTVAELTDEQIDYFLPHWCHANAIRGQVTPSNSSTSKEEQEVVTRNADKQLKELKAAIQENEAVKELATVPLLLTLLAVMQQNSVSLPRQRVELYSTVTLTLLENRNIAKKLEPIPEKQAIQYLGPLAFAMQEKNNSFARERDVMDALVKTIGVAGGTPEDITQQAERFLQRIRERGGLFVQRTGDYFGFFHRTFQEYFAARYLLNMIKQDAAQGIEDISIQGISPG